MLRATVSVRYNEYHGIVQWEGYGYLLVQETLEENATCGSQVSQLASVVP